MHVALLTRRIVAAASLLVAAAGCASEPEIHSVLVIEAPAADASSPPIDLEQAARAQGCATDPILPVGVITLTVDAVVSPREFIITGRYGRERIRPWLEIETMIRLERLGAYEGEITESLRRELVGKRLLEPASSLAPAVTADGLRLAGLYTPDLEPFDSVMSSMLERWPGALSSDAPSLGDIDLAVVPCDAASLQERVRMAVEEAERWSDFRAPPGLVVEWGDSGDMGDAVASVLDEDEPDPCVAAAHLNQFTESGDLWGISLPGGRVVIQEDRDWRELDLHWVLLHELMHQHQYGLCAAGLDLGKVSPTLWQAHATSLALEILRRQGLSEAELAFVQERDVLNGATRAFDELRTQAGLGADEFLEQLASDPDLAERVRTEVEGPHFWNMTWSGEHPREFAPAFPNDGLSFECEPAEGLVAIINESDSPYSGASDGWWFSKSSGADGVWRQNGDAPFALCLPPRGRVTLKTGALPADADPATCFTTFRTTPSPVFGR